MAQSKKDIVAQAFADLEEYALSAFVTSLNDGHSSFSTDVQPAGLKEYWETIRSLGGSHAWPWPEGAREKRYDLAQCNGLMLDI